MSLAGELSDVIRAAVAALNEFPSVFKVDFFVFKEQSFARAVMNRRRLETLWEFGGQELYLVSPEDVVLLKLEGYWLGGEVSDRQWSDVLGVLQARHESLDRRYLARSAMDLGVSDLLERAMKEAEG